MSLTALKVRNAAGERLKWGAMRNLVGSVRGKQIGNVLSCNTMGTGKVCFTPVEYELPMDDRLANLFRDVCLSMLATFPGMLGRRREERWLDVHHSLEDKHHSFELTGDKHDQILHVWGPHSARSHWAQGDAGVEATVANMLGIPEEEV
ncbi:hypothetical protein V7S43_010498 [Phytophthora oleae]|uniref:Uncharacterized protein n=1 Tax=Phytophthora oleae TaxID=2107226 RepID=A0ABD3FGD7_9STRA